MNENIRNRVERMKAKSLLFTKPTKEFYTIVALGNTGVGKSSLLNMLGDTNEFQVGEGANAQTKVSLLLVFFNF
jgi:putative ribosome biogenesis GTPase RsgA